MVVGLWGIFRGFGFGFGLAHHPFKKNEVCSAHENPTNCYQSGDKGDQVSNGFDSWILREARNRL